MMYCRRESHRLPAWPEQKNRLQPGGFFVAITRSMSEFNRELLRFKGIFGHLARLEG